MEKYDDFAFASKENLENLSKAYNNNLKVDALNTGEKKDDSVSPNQEDGKTISPNQPAVKAPTMPNQENKVVPLPTKSAKQNNSLSQFNLLLFAMVLSIINDSFGCYR